MSVGVIHQFVFLGRPELSKFAGNKSPFRLQRTRLGLDSKWVILESPPKAASASSSSVSGSGADYSEQLLGSKPKGKRQKIAGIDQDELLDPALLADPDSRFCEFKGVQIHHKVCNAESPTHDLFQDKTSSQSPYQTKKIGLPMILLHGFGASVFSWGRVMKPLAQSTGSKVLAFDRPAFGLTSRVNLENSSSVSDDRKPLNPYSMMFSVLATLYFIDFLAAEKAVLVGHSAGSLVAVQTYFEAPERVAALILVGPAILAPLIVRKVAKGNQSGRNSEIQEDSSNSNTYGNPFIMLGNILSKFSKYIVQAIMHLVKGMVDMLNSLYKKALSALLRSAIAVMLVRMVIDKFGIAAVRNSWYDSKQVTDHVLYGYTKPLRARGWDRALVEYTAAMLTDSVSESKPPLGERLSEISCPVLIVTGDTDRLVPSWNSERLSRAIPGSSLEVIKNCGHLPQEERAEQFVSIVEKFLERVFSGLEEQRLQAAS
uniref:AB hydrolase-1 domain-containing protein n=1 Tax=Davidia involucrata TaxID=16924 RepID=A0A5B6YI54_DAVIN